MPASSSGIAITRVSTTQELPLGWEVEVDNNDGNGPLIYVYVQNGEASSSFTIGVLVQRKASTTTKIGTISTTTALPAHGYLGVAQFTIAAASYGFLLKRGKGSVLADTGNITVNQGLVPGTTVAGTIKSTGTATTATLGWAHTAITAAATGIAYIDIRG